MKRSLVIIMLVWMFGLVGNAQQYNPFVSLGDISPKPLLPLEFGGSGVISFRVGNTGTSSLPLIANQEMTLVLTLANGVPNNMNPLAAISGPGAAYFDWVYNPSISTYSAIQNQEIPAQFSGQITIDYRVTVNTTQAVSGNGFNVNLQPPPYSNGSNIGLDDAVNGYTFVRARDFGDAPLSYGSAGADINLYRNSAGNYANFVMLGDTIDADTAYLSSALANRDDLEGINDEDGVSFPAMIPGTTVTIPVKITVRGGTFHFLNAWIDWNGDGDFLDAGEQIVSNTTIFTSQTLNLSVNIPANAVVGTTFARFRIGSIAGPVGLATYGEVEDYRVTIGGAVPQIALEKTGTYQDNAPLGVYNAGDVINYQFTVTNTGGVPLSNVTISDPLVSVSGGPIMQLASGASDNTTFTASYVLTQADIDAGTLTNTAEVTGFFNGQPVTDTDDDTQTFIQNSSLQLYKTITNVSGDGLDGDEISYLFTVTNTGNVTITNVIVNDALTGSVNLGVTPSTLAPGQMGTATASYTITSADVNIGYVENSATTEGIDPGSNIVEDISDAGDDLVETTDGIGGTDGDPTNDPTVYRIGRNPEIELLKEGTWNDTNNDGFAQVGETITYAFTVTNTGNVAITNLVINDAVIGVTNLAVTPSTLTPGATGTAQVLYPITQSDIDAGGKFNIALVTGQDPNGDEVEDESEDPTPLSPPDPICPNCTFTELPNNPEIRLYKTIQSVSGDGEEGDEIIYLFTVTNTGNVTLSDVTIDDVLTGSVNQAIVPGVLLPGQSGTTTSSYIITAADVNRGYVENSATTRSLDPENNDVEDISDAGNDLVETPDGLGNTDGDPTNDPTVYRIGRNPQITLLKEGTWNDANNDGFAQPGETITYSFTVTNTGNVTISNLVINDAVIGVSNLSVTPSSLSAGAVGTAQFIYTITQADINDGGKFNIALVSGQDPDGELVEDESEDPTPLSPPDPLCPNCTYTELPQNPNLRLYKTITNVTGSGLEGDVITYLFTVTNTGNVTLTNVVVDDILTASSNLSVTPSVLAPGESGTATATHTIILEDVNLGYVENSATTTGTDPKNNPVVDISDAGDDLVETPDGAGNIDGDPTNDPTVLRILQSPEINLLKVGFWNDVNNDGYAQAGETITYSFEVTNIGNVTISNLRIDDAILGITNLAVVPSTLAPGEIGKIQYIYTVTQTDVDAGGKFNIAVAKGDGPNGQEVEDESEDPVPLGPPNPNCPNCTYTELPQNPVIRLYKTISGVSGDGAENDVISYLFTVTNTGNVTITNVVVNDALTGSVNLAVTPSTLAPGQSGTATATYTITLTDVNRGYVENSATTRGLDPDNTPVEDISDAGNDLVETPDGLGNTDGDPTNDPTVYRIGRNPEITLLKEGTWNDANNDGFAQAGETITYAFTVTNTGNVTISNLVINDAIINVTNLAVTPSTLAPGQVGTAQFVYTITQSDVDAKGIYNIAIATGEDPEGEEVEDESEDPTPLGPPNPDCPDCTYTELPDNPEIELLKEGTWNDANNDGVAQAGETITYAFTVTNTGNVTISNLVINDAVIGVSNLAVTPSTLAPGATGTAQFVYNTTITDIEAGGKYNIAVATGEDPEGEEVEDESEDPTPLGPPNPDCPDCTYTELPDNPEIELLKEGTWNDANNDGVAQLGETITYAFTVTNTGNVTISNLVINDAVIGVSNLAVTPSTLAPGATGTAQFVYITTITDIEAGGKYNIAVATGEDPEGEEVEDESEDPTPLSPEDPNYDPNCPDCTYTDLPGGLGQIGSFVWEDTNGNGIQDIGEPGIPGVLVNLYTSEGGYVRTTTTDMNGQYVFTNVSSGMYYVEFVTPNGLTTTFGRRGNDDSKDSDIEGINGPGTTRTITVGTGINTLNIDAGYYRCIPIGDLVWYDINKNDVWDSNENGINQLRVNLWRNHFGTWLIWDRTSTGHRPGTPSDDGYWRFCAPPGEYYVEIVMPSFGLVRARPFIGPDRTKDSDITNANGPTTTNRFTVRSGDERLDIGAGFYPEAKAGQLVWIDSNLDGVQDSDEPRVEGVMVEAVELSTGTVITSSYTDADGIYEIEGLEKQSYYMRFYPPEGMYPTVSRATVDDRDSDVDGSNGLNTTRAIAFEPGMVKNNIDLGLSYAPLPVDWMSIRANRVNETHVVTWSVAREVNVSHYVVERRMSTDKKFVEISGEIKGEGNSTQTLHYDKIDEDVSKAGVYVYRVKQYDYDGKYTYSPLARVSNNGENSVDMYPNPARNETTIQVTLSEDAEVKIEMYDATSKLVKVIKGTQIQKAGDMIYKTGLEDVPAGVYNVLITIDGVVTQKKLIRIE